MEVQISPWEGAILVNRGAYCKSIGTFCRELLSCAKTAEPIDLPFWLWTPVGRRMHKFNRIRQVVPICLTTIFRDLYKNG